MRTTSFVSLIALAASAYPLAFMAAGGRSGSKPADAPPPPPATGTDAPPPPAAAASASSAKPTYTIDNDVIAPEVKRGGGRGGQSLYPFDDLTAPVVGADGKVTSMQSIFVEGKQAKNMASTILSANKRYEQNAKNPDGSDKFTTSTDGAGVTIQTPVKEATRKFKAFNVKAATDKSGKDGVRIFRIL